MVNFPTIKTFSIPEGVVTKVESNGVVLWALRQGNYVSFGDSIAAGHAIDANWDANYGERSQFSYKQGDYVFRTEPTTIVPDSYTDLIKRDLVATYGTNTSTTSFARSGDKVSDLLRKEATKDAPIGKLFDTQVINAIKDANIVTLCIGANDILSHVYPEIGPYVYSGDLSSLEASVENSLAVLNTDSNANSYISLFNRLNEINPNAKYVFTTIYNPYKYLWIDEGRNGFFGPVLDVIPSWDITIPIINKTYSISNTIKDGILQTPIIQLLFSRVNGLGDWVEKYIEGRDSFDGLNRILRNKINSYKATHPNFAVAETKALFDTYPDRPVSADIHYNDLVNVEFTRGYTTGTMDWGALWRDSDAGTYWWNLFDRHIEIDFGDFSISDPINSVVHIDWEYMAKDLAQDTLYKVIIPNIDPHPETYGHQVLKQSFANVLDEI